MHIVIDIPERDYTYINKLERGSTDYGTTLHLYDAVRNGTPLPKGHGDLIDRDDLLADSYCIDDWSGNEVNIIDVMTVNMADIIIEANKEEQHEYDNRTD